MAKEKRSKLGLTLKASMREAVTIMATTKPKIGKTSKAKKTDEMFGEIAGGLNEAIRYAKGTASKKAFRAHIPEGIDVRAIRKKPT